MSISASLDLKVIKNSIYDFSAQDLLSEMISKNWRLINEGKTCYLPLEDELFEWTEEVICESKLLEMISQKEKNGEVIGVVLYWKDTDIGISVLIFPDYEITFNITINRMKLDDIFDNDITDVNWYIRKIVPCFHKFKIGEIKFIQTW